MDPDPDQDSKASVSWFRDDESGKKRDSSAPPTQGHLSQDEHRPIRRVRSPPRPRARPPGPYHPKPGGGHFYKPRFSRDPHLFHKSSFHRQNHTMRPRGHFHRRDPVPFKYHHHAPREGGAGSPPPQSGSRPFGSRSSSSRDKDTFTVSDREQRRTRSRDRDPPSSVSQTAARDRAIQQKRREIDEVYHQECEMFGFVVKMLISKDPALEAPIQASLQKNLQDVGRRCIAAMEAFIQEYDSRD